MRKSLLALWVVLPLLVVVYHLAAGERHQTMDQVGDHIRSARGLMQKSSLTRAVSEFEKAIELLPDDADNLRRELRLELAQARMQASQLPDAHAELKRMLDEITGPNAAVSVPESFENRVRESLATAQYYMAWLMRLEGLSRDEWEPEIESARQNYRLLAERAENSGDQTGKTEQLENLEASIRLARMELSDLQGLPIPKPCNCCSSGKCRARREGPPKNGPPKDARGASAGPPADGSGS